MRNFPVKVDGKEYWISRSTSVVCLILDDKGEKAPRIVACKRGKGCPDAVGLWNVPSGFIDYDETIKQAASRETNEECGLNIPPEDWKLHSVMSDPKDNERQTISFRMLCHYKPEFGTTFTTENSEPDEVDDVKWITLDDIPKYRFAFHQDKIIKNFLTTRPKKSHSSDLSSSKLSMSGQA